MQHYSTKKWLNSIGSPSTGSIAAYSGESPWEGKGTDMFSTFLEIADCGGKIRLHQSTLESPQQFVDKLTVLRDETDKFIAWLKRGS